MTKWFLVVFLVGLLALSAEVYGHCTSDHTVFIQQQVLGVDSALHAWLARYQVTRIQSRRLGRFVI